MPERTKFKLTNLTETVGGRTLYRVQSLKEFRTSDGKIIKEGTIGGFVSDIDILSQDGTSWIGNDACVIDGKVTGNALVKDRARLYETSASDDVFISDTVLCHNASVSCNAMITNNSYVDSAIVTDKSCVCDNARVVGDTHLSCLSGNTCVLHNARVGNSNLVDTYVLGDSTVDDSYICGYDVCKSSHLKSVTLQGRTGNVSDSILENIHVYAPCRFRDAHITKQDEFWFLIAHSKGLSYIALYPNCDGEIVVVYHGNGYPETVSPDDFDKIVKGYEYMPLKRWRAIKKIALASIKKSRKE